MAIHYDNEIYCITDIHYSTEYDAWNWYDYMGPQPEENRQQWDGRITHWADPRDTIHTLQMAYNTDNHETKD